MEPCAPVRFEIGGYILAGGRSSRMGQDKALITLGGMPLIEHAVRKLRRICADVSILSAEPALAAYAPIVPDLHPNSGPLGGIEAALSDSVFDWSLILPVDVPFLPTAFLDQWVRSAVERERQGTRIMMFTVDGMPQPTLCLLHREVLPYLTDALEKHDFKLYPVFEHAGRELAERRKIPFEQCFCNLSPWNDVLLPRPERVADARWCDLSDAQRSAQPLWFSNLNTPQDLAFAQTQTALLDTLMVTGE